MNNSLQWKILLAEDEKLLLRTMAFYFEKKGFIVTQASDGNIAINELKKNTFDIIVTDINMPYANGMEIVNLVRNELKLNTPVIVLTTVGLEKTQLNAFEIGANEFITKPFSFPVLVTRILKLLQLKNA